VSKDELIGMVGRGLDDDDDVSPETRLSLLCASTVEALRLWAIRNVLYAIPMLLSYRWFLERYEEEKGARSVESFFSEWCEKIARDYDRAEIESRVAARLEFIHTQ
jgi:hypothetical protein